MIEKFKNNDLIIIAKNIRWKTVNSLYIAKSGHLGPSLSIVEILTALYFNILSLGDKLQSNNLDQRDIFILSKGHAAPALYATLAEAGLISEDLLLTLRKIESPLQGHPERHRLEYIDATTGSLGQGISMAQGYALAQKSKKLKTRTFCIIGDGETQEGQVWETAISAPKFKLDNLICITDNNGYQNEGSTEETMPLNCPTLIEKWQSFGWEVESIDGHNIEAIIDILLKLNNNNGKPKMIIANTIKGKGISFSEGNPIWHSKEIDDLSYKIAYSELNN